MRWCRGWNRGRKDSRTSQGGCLPWGPAWRSSARGPPGTQTARGAAVDRGSGRPIEPRSDGRASGVVCDSSGVSFLGAVRRILLTVGAGVEASEAPDASNGETDRPAPWARMAGTPGLGPAFDIAPIMRLSQPPLPHDLRGGGLAGQGVREDSEGGLASRARPLRVFGEGKGDVEGWFQGANGSAGNVVSSRSNSASSTLRPRIVVSAAMATSRVSSLATSVPSRFSARSQSRRAASDRPR